MKLVIFNLLVFGFIFSGQAQYYDRAYHECKFIFQKSAEDINKCKNNFDFNDIRMMASNLIDIQLVNWDIFYIDKGRYRPEEHKEVVEGLKNILSISSKPLSDAFEKYSDSDFEVVKSFVIKMQDKYPLLTSQITSVLTLELCSSIFFYFNTADIVDVNECKDKFDYKEVSLMNYVLEKIKYEGWSRIDQLEAVKQLQVRNVLRNILSISSEPLLDIFDYFNHSEFKFVEKWIQDNRDTDPLLTSQIESMFSDPYNVRLCNTIFYIFSSKKPENLCNKFDSEEVYLMRSVLMIAFQGDDWDRINGQEKRNALRNILSISPGPLFEIFRELLYYDDDPELNLVQSWIEDNRDIDPSLTSQIERAVSYFLSLPSDSYGKKDLYAFYYDEDSDASYYDEDSDDEDSDASYYDIE